MNTHILQEKVTTLLPEKLPVTVPSGFLGAGKMVRSGEARDEEDDRTVSDFLIEQVEFADVLVLNKNRWSHGKIFPPCSLFPSDPYCADWEPALDTHRYTGRGLYSFTDGHVKALPFAVTYQSSDDNMWDLH